MKLKTSWHFTKRDVLNIVFVIQYFWCFKDFVALQIFFYMFLLKWRTKWDFESSVFFQTQKCYFVFESRHNIYSFSNGRIHNVVLTLPKVVKIYVWNDNVVSTLSNLVQINVVNFNVDVHNVFSTLIWHWAMSRRHINPKTTLKWRGNDCRELAIFNFIDPLDTQNACINVLDQSFLDFH